MSHLMNTYARLPVAFERGEGVWLWDTNGKRYLDAVAGVAVNTLGHAHPRLAATLCEQAQKLIHTSNLYQIPLQEALATRLCQLADMDRAFFCNSGAEANEAAIKLARLYGHQKGIDLPTILVMEKSFHGRTLATLTASGSRKVQAGFEPLVSGFARVPYNDVEAVRQAVEHNPNIVAILVEPVQGEGGINIPNRDYLAGLRRLCDEKGLLLMLDEVQSGIARTGTWFAHQHADIKPDVMALAKGLGSGVPIGACLARGPAAEVFKPGNHGSTFGGNPLACAAGLTVLRVIEEEKLLDNVVRVGAYLRAGLTDALKDVPGVVEVRGHGLMLGIELDRPCGEIVTRALEAGLLVNVTSERIVRLVPPLILREDEAQHLIDGLVPVIKTFLGAAGKA
ncbi:acetylornithine transaminase [Thiobacter aerophilum]|uniref:Acetylornithine aminotransferase n=1 Tax=Thiobacter aerophilum TaxID=3121275 RepID=A0ABV0EHC7_9BURK